MKTSITQKFHDTRAGQEANRILRNCVHCGFCNATCPTYQLLGDELDGPRGRIYLIKQVLEGKQASMKTQSHLDRCLTCRNCETTCPSGVHYGRLLDIGRQLVTEEVKRPIGQQLTHYLLRKLFLRRFLFSASLFAGRLLRPLLPAAIGQSVPAPGSDIRSWPGQDRSRKVILVRGCVQPRLQPDIDRAAAAVFDRAGIESLRLDAAGCCGALSHHLNAEDEALSYIKRNIDAWWPYIESGEIEAITMTASGCGVMIRDYKHLLAADDDYARRAEKVSELYRDPVEIIAAEPSITDNLVPVGKRTRIAFHPPCTLQHGMKLSGRIEPILTSLGYELVEFADSHLCCGSGGTYSITQKKLSQQLRSNKLDAIESTQPELIVTANIGCQTHLQAGTDIPVRHWLELLC